MPANEVILVSHARAHLMGYGAHLARCIVPESRTALETSDSEWKVCTCGLRELVGR